MKLTVFSHKDDRLELEVEPRQPNVVIGEMEIDGVFYPWHPIWDHLPLPITEEVSGADMKVQKFYHQDKEVILHEDVAVACKRFKGKAVLESEAERWELKGCRVFKYRGCGDKRDIVLAFDEVTYKAL